MGGMLLPDPACCCHPLASEAGVALCPLAVVGAARITTHCHCCTCRVGLLPIVRRERPYITAPQKTLPPPYLRSAARQTAAMEAESDADSDSAFMPPSPSCRRRKLFPITREEAAAARQAKHAPHRLAEVPAALKRIRATCSSHNLNNSAERDAESDCDSPPPTKRAQSRFPSPPQSPPVTVGCTGLLQPPA